MMVLSTFYIIARIFGNCTRVQADPAASPLNEWLQNGIIASSFLIQCTVGAERTTEAVRRGSRGGQWEQ